MSENPSDTPVPDATPSLGSNVRRGALWTVSSSLLMRLANVALMAVVARLIIPEEFGVFALALAVYGFVSSFAELGIASAVARVDLDIDRIAPTVTTIACATSLVLGGAMAALADPIARFLGSAAVAEPLRILAIAVVLIGPFAVPGAQLQREFRQGRLFVANAIAFVPTSGILLGLLLTHHDGAVAFAWSRVAGQLTVGLIMTTAVSRIYRPGFDRTQLSLLFGFGLPLAGASILGQVVGNVDFVFVGRMLNATAVGLYTLAFNVANWASSAIGSMLNGVILPAFSSVKQHSDQLVRAVRRAVRLVAVVAFLVSSMTAGLAQPLVTVLYGSQWTQAAPVLRVLALVGALSVIGQLLANVVVAMGRTGSLFLVQVMVLVALVPGLYLGIGHGGLMGAAWVHVVVMLVVTAPTYLRALRSTTGTTIRSVLTAMLPPLVAGVLAALVAHTVSLAPMPDLLRLLVGGSVGGGLYVVLMARDLADMVGAHNLPSWAARAVAASEPMRRWLVGPVDPDDSFAGPGSDGRDDGEGDGQALPDEGETR